MEKKIVKKVKPLKVIPYTYDTKVSVLEENLNLKPSKDKDMKLGDYIKKIGYPSLAKMLED